MMLDWNAYRRQLLAGTGEIARMSPDVVRGFRQLSAAGAKTGKLDPKTRDLIALAVSVTRQCDGGIAMHADGAVKHGATREEVLEAIGVAIAINAVAALVCSARAMDVSAARSAEAREE